MIGRLTGRDDGTVEGRITEALESVRGTLGVESGAITLVRFDAATGVAVLRLDGGCPDCDLSLDMLVLAIGAHLHGKVQEVRGVETEGEKQRR